jgi:DUF971 family protein
MTVRPAKLGLSGDNGLSITWSDGQVREYTFRELRDACPCATCREKRSHPAPATLLPVLTAAEAQPLKLKTMEPVGQYAYGVVFSDGHDTGIYTFELLRQLGREVPV